MSYVNIKLKIVMYNSFTHLTHHRAKEMKIFLTDSLKHKINSKPFKYFSLHFQPWGLIWQFKIWESKDAFKPFLIKRQLSSTWRQVVGFYPTHFLLHHLSSSQAEFPWIQHFFITPHSQPEHRLDCFSFFLQVSSHLCFEFEFECLRQVQTTLSNLSLNLILKLKPTLLYTPTDSMKPGR